MSRVLGFGAALALVLVLAAGLGLSAPAPEPGEKDPRSPQQIEEAQRYLRSLRKLAEGTNPDMEELWMTWQRFRTTYAGTPEWRAACEVMAKAPSPLDKLDRDAIPEEDRPAWLPKEVVAVLGEMRGRQDGFYFAVSPDGRFILCTPRGRGPGGGPLFNLLDPATLLPRVGVEGIGYPWFSGDGKTLALLGPDRWTIRLWDLGGDKPKVRMVVQTCAEARGTDEISRFEFYKKHSKLIVEQLALSADGKTLFASNDDSELWRWDVSGEKAKELPPLKRDGAGDPMIACASDAQALVDGAGVKYAARVWDLSKEPPQLRCTVSRFSHDPLAVSPDGKMLAVTDAGFSIQLWDVSGEAKPLKLLQGHTDRIRRLAFSPDGQTLASVSDDKTLRLWPLTEARAKQLGLDKAQSFRAETFPFTPIRLGFLPDGKALALAGEDGTIRVYDLEKRAERVPLHGHCGALWSLAFAPDGKTLATGGEDCMIRLWDVTGAKARAVASLPQAHTNPVGHLAFSPDGNLLASGCESSGFYGHEDRRVRLWDLTGKGPKEKASWEPHDVQLTALAFAQAGKQLITGGQESGPVGHTPTCVRLWDVSGDRPTQEQWIRVPPPEGYEPNIQVKDVALNPDGKVLAFWTERNCLRLYDLSRDGVKARKVEQPLREIDSLALSPDGKTLAVGGFGESRDVQMLSLSNTGLTPSGFLNDDGPGATRCLTFSPDGQRLLASVPFDGEIVLKEVATGRVLGRWRLMGIVLQLAFSPDGRYFAAACTDNNAYIFRLGKPMKTTP